MREKALAIVGLALFFSCAHRKPVNEMSHEELSHFVLERSLALPAMSGAIGAFEEDALASFARRLSPQSFEKLKNLSRETFDPRSVYAKIHAQATLATSKDEVLSLAKRMDSRQWTNFIEALAENYSVKGYEKVEEAMRALDEEQFELDRDKAELAESLSVNALDFNMVKLLFSKTGKRAPVEEFLYRKSLFVSTYLAVEEFSLEEISSLNEIRGRPTHAKLRASFEKVISRQYDIFFEKLHGYAARGK